MYLRTCTCIVVFVLGKSTFRFCWTSPLKYSQTAYTKWMKICPNLPWFSRAFEISILYSQCHFFSHREFLLLVTISSFQRVSLKIHTFSLNCTTNCPLYMFDDYWVYKQQPPSQFSPFLSEKSYAKERTIHLRSSQLNHKCGTRTSWHYSIILLTFALSAACRGYQRPRPTLVLNANCLPLEFQATTPFIWM